MVSIAKHCIVGLLIRICFIIYGEIQDNTSEVSFTDVDYRVFTDAARHVVTGSSPYNRHTYRYSPILAYIMVPNVLLHVVWGKIVLSLVDVGLSFLIYRLVKCNAEFSSIICATIWLYNPLAIIISTRGNVDSLSAALVLITLLLLDKKKIVYAGMVHGLAIHLRLYPVVFSLPIYLSLRTSNSRSWGLIPNLNQLNLAVSCMSTVTGMTAIFYIIYGYKFLQESFLYHVTRSDCRHNFSVYFYMTYLTAVGTSSFLQKILMFAPQGVLLLVFSFLYSSKSDITFCLFMQAFIMVMYNPVMTSQYFIWFLSLLPVCTPKLVIPKRRGIMLAALWSTAQILWLIPAYFLEFKGYNTFLLIWVQGIAFFCVNVIIVVQLVRFYNHSKI